MDFNEYVGKKTLYNKERKCKFVNHYSRSDSMTMNAISLFKQVAKYEEKIGKDICEMNAEELESALSETNVIKTKGLIAYVSLIKSYVKWCKEYGIENVSDAIAELKPSGIDAIKRRYVSGPKQLKAYTDLMFSDECLRQSDITLRGFLWLAFSGVQKELSDKITCEDIDFLNLRITHDGVGYPIYAESLSTLHILAEENTFVYINPEYTKTGHLVRNRMQSDKLLRGIRGDANAGQLGNQLSRIARDRYAHNKVKAQLSYNSVSLSGKFYREHEAEVAGFPTTFKSIVEEELRNDGHIVNDALYERYRKERMRYMKREYELWKLAFGM